MVMESKPCNVTSLSSPLDDSLLLQNGSLAGVPSDGLFSNSQWKDRVLAAQCMLLEQASTVLLLWFELLTVVNIYQHTG